MRLDSGDNHNKRGIGFRFAWNGIMLMLQERNFRIQLIVALLVIVTGMVVQLSMFEWLIVIITIGMVITLEMVNTTVETLLDYLKPEIHPTAKVIKDVAAGAVLIAAMTAIMIGLLIFLPKLYYLF